MREFLRIEKGNIKTHRSLTTDQTIRHIFDRSHSRFKWVHNRFDLKFKLFFEKKERTKKNMKIGENIMKSGDIKQILMIYVSNSSILFLCFYSCMVHSITYNTGSLKEKKKHFNLHNLCVVSSFSLTSTIYQLPVVYRK